MKNKQTSLSKATLKRMMAEFSTHEWSDRELEELVKPTYGVITGFQQINEGARKLIEIDLDTTEPA